MPYKLIDKLKNIIGTDPVFSVRAAISPLFLVVTWQDSKHPLPIFCLTKGRDSYLALNEKEYVAIATDKFREYFNGKISIKELQAEYDAWEKDIFVEYEILTNKDLSELTNEELGHHMCKLNDLFLDLARITIYIENVDYEKILSVIGLSYKEKLDKIWDRATEAAFISFESRRLKKLLDISTSNHVNSIRKSKFMFTDYFWPKNDDSIIAALTEIKNNFDEKKDEYQKSESAALALKEKHNEWLVTLDPESRKIAEYAQLVMQMRDTRKDPIAQMHVMLSEVSVVMLHKASIDVKFAPLVLLYEYIRGVEYLSSIKPEIEKRADGCMYIAHPDQSYEIELCEFEKAIIELKKVTEIETEKTDNFKGQIACKGNVKGIVRVILDPHDDKGFQKGDILVTSMTRPEFVPIMKKAGGVITDEGGITCHAAIISRELNIPCIIGTKLATKILKDGMRVEVDADNGIVRILN